MKIILSLFLIFVLMLTLIFEVDNSALVLQEEALHRAFMAFGLAKGLNAIISLIQGTELSFTPVGIGLTFSVGEVLDPFNDMVERFSWVMLAASVSLGIQKLLLILSAKLFLQVVLTLSIVTSLTLLWFDKFQKYKSLFYSLKLFAFLVILRLSAVVFIYSSELLYISVLEVEYKEASAVVESTKKELDALEKKNSNVVKSNKNESTWEWVGSNVNKVKKSLDISSQLKGLEKSIDDASKNIITLITIFILQSMLMPLLFLWLSILSMKVIFKLEFNEEKLKLLYNHK